MLGLALTLLSQTAVRSHTSISEGSSGTGHGEDTPDRDGLETRRMGSVPGCIWY